MPDAAASIPNFFTDRLPWQDIYFAGQRVLAALTEINDVSTEDAWQKQKSKETSGAVAVFQGTTWGDFSLTFEATDSADFDDLRILWKLLAPNPSKGTGTGTVKIPTQVLVVGSPSATDSVITPSTDFVIPNNEPSKIPSVGPRPPTISVQHPILAWHGITAAARKKWEGPTPTATNGVRVKITMIADKPPRLAGTGAMGPPQPSSRYTGTTQISAPQDSINKNAAAGAAGV